MKSMVWIFLVVVLLSYGSMVAMLGFPGIVAYSVHFIRITISIAVLWVFIPVLPKIFKEVPPPGRDYLLMGIALMWLSNISFSFWNEMGRVFKVDTSIFTSPIAGLFSLLVLCGGVFHLLAPSTDKPRTRYIALVAGLTGATALVIVAPYFR